MQHSITVKTLSDTDSAAERFISEIEPHRLVAFYAPMGAGKTTFIKAVCSALGVQADAVSSPTFAIVNEYRTSVGESVYHFDFYRITKDEEALDIGLYDYLDSGSICFMEWPENIENLLPEETLKVFITVESDLSRTITWSD